MRAARWDLTWEVGSPWSAILRRRDLSAATLPLAPGCRLEIRSIDAPSTVSALLTLPGLLVDDDPAEIECRLGATAAQTRALGPGGFQHVLYVGIPGVADPIIWSRGFLRARDRAGDRG